MRNDEIEHDEDEVAYMKELLSDMRFESAVGCMARHISGDDGYHSVPQLFWGVLRDGEAVARERGEDDEEAISAPIEERLQSICDALDIVKDCVAILSTSEKYEKAITAQQQLRKFGIDFDLLDTKPDNSNRLLMIEQKLDVVLECLLILTAPQVVAELEAAKTYFTKRGKGK